MSTDVVTCVLTNKKNEILILKRSDKVKTYKGLWGGVAGYVEKDEKPVETAFKEIKEETGLNENEVNLVKKIDLISFRDVDEGEEFFWHVHPFVFRVEKKGKINIDWEHSEYRWIPPSKIFDFDTVPHFKELVSKEFL